MSSSGGLTAEQKMRIEENRRKALALKQAKDAKLRTQVSGSASNNAQSRPSFTARPMQSPPRNPLPVDRMQPKQTFTASSMQSPPRNPIPVNRMPVTAPIASPPKQNAPQIMSPSSKSVPFSSPQPKSAPPWINKSPVSSKTQGNNPLVRDANAAKPMPFSSPPPKSAPPWINKSPVSSKPPLVKDASTANSMPSSSPPPKSAPPWINKSPVSLKTPLVKDANTANSLSKSPGSKTGPPPWLSRLPPSTSSSIVGVPNAIEPRESVAKASTVTSPGGVKRNPPWLENRKDSGSESNVQDSNSAESQPPWLNKNRAHQQDDNSAVSIASSSQNENNKKSAPPWLANKASEAEKSNQKPAPPWIASGSGDQQKGKDVPPWLGAKSNAQAKEIEPPVKKIEAPVVAPEMPVAPKMSQVTGQCMLISRQRFQVEVGYAAILINVFKSMETKNYDPQTKKWSFDLKEYNAFIQKIKGLAPDILITPLPFMVASSFSSHIQGTYKEKLVAEADLGKVDRELVQNLMPFQREGVNFAIQRRGRLLFADDMGLGKTIQAICVACYYKQEWPLLVVVPSSVRFAWREQFIKWVPSLDPQQINVVVTGKESCTSGLINILSYDIMQRKSEPLLAKGFRVVIMDESHSLKNVKTARTKAAVPLLKRAKRVLLLSGTPALSRPSELFMQLNAIDPHVFNKFHDFGLRYCDGKQNNWGWDFSGFSNLAELQLILEERIMIRRLKKDVLHQLPSKIRQMVILDPCSVKSTKSMKASHKMVDKMKGTERHGALLEYFHETCNAKTQAVREYVCDLLEGGRKVLVFGHHSDMLDQIEEVVDHKGYGYIRIDGRTPTEQRSFLVNKFQTQSSIRVAVLSIMACNSGLNLTAASLVVFAELFWNPGILVQAEDRAHRIGQDDSVTIHYLVAAGTADDYVWPLVQSKLEVLSRAGLTGDDFSEADTTRHVDPRQKHMMDYFEQSFIEDPWEVPETKEEDDGGGEQLGMIQPSTSKPKPVFATPPKKKTGKSKVGQSYGKASPAKQTSLFQFMKPSPKKPALDQSEALAVQELCKDASDWPENDGNIVWEEDSPDAPWPPPAKKYKT